MTPSPLILASVTAACAIGTLAMLLPGSGVPTPLALTVGAFFVIGCAAWVSLKVAVWTDRSRALDRLWEEVGKELGLTCELSPRRRRLVGTYRGVRVAADDRYAPTWMPSSRWLRASSEVAGVRIEIPPPSVSVRLSVRPSMTVGRWGGRERLGSQPFADLAPPICAALQHAMSCAAGDDYCLQLGDGTLSYWVTSFGPSPHNGEELGPSLRLAQWLILATRLSYTYSSSDVRTED